MLALPLSSQFKYVRLLISIVDITGFRKLKDYVNLTKTIAHSSLVRAGNCNWANKCTFPNDRYHASLPRLSSAREITGNHGQSSVQNLYGVTYGYYVVSVALLGRQETCYLFCIQFRLRFPLHTLASRLRHQRTVSKPCIKCS